MLGAEEYIASTGGGLYRTRNAGRSWSRMDEQLDRSYFRESFKSNGRLYTSAALKTPSYWGGERGADAALYESFDGGSSFQAVPYPGQPQDFVISWSSLNTDDIPIFAGTYKGNILERVGGIWTSFAKVPSTVRSLEVI